MHKNFTLVVPVDSPWLPTQRASFYGRRCQTPQCPPLFKHYCVAETQSTHFVYRSVADSSNVICFLGNYTLYLFSITFLSSGISNQSSVVSLAPVDFVLNGKCYLRLFDLASIKQSDICRLSSRPWVVLSALST